MEWFQVIILPLLLGLMGFFEPCSLSINAIFLKYVQPLTKGARIKQGLIFLFVRATVLGIIGLLAAFIGKKVFAFQQTYFVLLGVFIALLGVYELTKKHIPISFPALRFSALIPKKKSAALLGLVFGLVIPACAIPLVLVLVGTTLATGDLFQGFFSLFLFGTALSLPLLGLVLSEKSFGYVKKITAKMQAVPYVIGIVLIVLGIVTALSSVWWLQ